MYTKDLGVWCRHLPSSCRHLLDGIENTYSLPHTENDGACGDNEKYVEESSGTDEVQSANFQTYFREQSFCNSGRLDQFAGQAVCHFCWRNRFRVQLRRGLNHDEKRRKALLEEIEKMHARPEIREILIAGKLKRWALIGQHPHAYPNCSPARARRNFSRLFSRYPQIAQRLGMTPVSAYPAI